MRELMAHGVESEVVAPGSVAARYEIDGFTVHRLRIMDQILSPMALCDNGDPDVVRQFEGLLRKSRPDLVHFHARSRGVSLAMLRAVKLLGIPAIYTYHTPTATCANGTMLRPRGEACNGLMSRVRCAECVMRHKGLLPSAARVMARIPAFLSSLPGYAGWRSRLSTAVQTPALIDLIHRNSHSFLRETDHIVAVCEWVRDVLLTNGIGKEKITLSRQGLCQVPDEKANEPSATCENVLGFTRERPLKLVILGRLDVGKGIDLVVESILDHPELPVTLDIFGVFQDKIGNKYADGIASICKTDDRISLRPAIPASDVIRLLHSYDVLAVPSRLMETGPLVVLEAFAAGIPVIASKLGGICEIVRDGIDGILVDATSEEWSMALWAVVNDPVCLRRMSGQIKFPRTMRDVAEDMVEVYRGLLDK
jgi:glycosyltransferase involved in cell wall biosynthesis